MPSSERPGQKLEAAAQLIVSNAVTSWFLRGETAALAEAQARTALFPDGMARLLSSLKVNFDGHLPAPEEAAQVLRLRGEVKVAEVLEQMIEHGHPAGAMGLAEAWAALERNELRGQVAEILRLHATDPETLIAQIAALPRRAAPATGLDVLYFGDPEREPDLVVPEPLIEGLLHPGYVCASGPWKKSRKTLFLIAASFALAHGLPFLGRKTRQARVLWCQRDTPPSAFFKQYAPLIREGMGFPPVAIPTVIEPLNLADVADQARLVQVVKEQGTEVLFLDSAKALSRLDENDAGEVAGFVRDFICGRLRDELGLTVVLVSHPSRGATSIVRGSGDWEAAGDSILHFQPHLVGQATRFVDVFGEGRHPSFELAFTLDDLTPHGGGLAIREVKEEERTTLRKTSGKLSQEERVLAATQDGLWRSKKQIHREAGGNYPATLKAIINLFGRGLLEHDGEPEERRKWRCSSPCT
jgi:hypothetical protein